MVTALEHTPGYADKAAKKIVFDIGVMYYFDHYIISEIKEGVHLELNKCIQIIDNIFRYYSDRPFVYISNRVNSYSLDPTDYIRLSRMPLSIEGIAVVSDLPIARRNTNLERAFFEKPFELFEKLDDAIIWADTLIKKAPVT